jgi:hypothetical protein
MSPLGVLLLWIGFGSFVVVARGIFLKIDHVLTFEIIFRDLKQSNLFKERRRNNRTLNNTLRNRNHKYNINNQRTNKVSKKNSELKFYKKYIYK